MKAYSVDLRQRVVEAVERGQTLEEVARTFQVSQGSIKRWRKCRREGRSLEGRKPSGRPASITSRDEDVIRRLVQDTPDATLDEHAQRWKELHGKALSQWSIGRAIRRLGLSRKKSH